MHYLEMEELLEESGLQSDVENNDALPVENSGSVEEALVYVSKSELVFSEDQQQYDKQIMNYDGNISEAGPATAADISVVHNPNIFNDTSDIEYITKIGGSGIVAENLRKQSLYVKFDPLVAAAAADSSSTMDDDSLCDQMKNTTLIEKGALEEGSPNTSLGKLISITPSKTPSPPKVASTTSDQDEISKLHSLLLKQMKKEETFQEEINHLKADCEHISQNLVNAENEISKLNATLETVRENEIKLKKELKDKIKSKQELSMVMEEYEKTISQMVMKREEEKKEYEAELKRVEAERDSTVQHLNNLEIAFNDVHQKYERGKAVNESLKKNEDKLKKSLAEYEKTVKIVENKYEMLKSHASAQLEKANQELELITQSYENEQARLKALLRKSEVQVNSLQDALDRKVKENQELTSICDELIVKLSSHSNSQS